MTDLLGDDLTMIAATLQRLQRAGILDVPRAADATGLDESAIYKWIAGSRAPSFTNFLLLFKHSDPQVQRELLALLTRGTAWRSDYLERGSDPAGDGDYNIGAVIQACQSHVQCWNRMVSELTSIAIDHSGAIGEEQYETFQQYCDIAEHDIARTRRAIEWLHQQRRRRKARPLAVNGSEVSRG